MTRNFSRIAAVLGLTMLGVAAQAQITVTSSIPVTATPWNTSTPPPPAFTVPQFDPTNGTLTSISFTVSGSATSTITVNATTSTTILNTSAGAVINVNQPDNTLLTQVVPTITVAGPITIPGGTIQSFGPSSNTATNSGSFSSPALLALYIGTGTVSLNADANGFVSSTLLGGNASSGQVTDASATLLLTYNFTPPSTGDVPEPGTVALFTGAVAFGGLMLRRRLVK